jgi:cytochrome b561
MPSQDLLALHHPLSIAILILAAIRLPLRLLTGAPALPSDLPPLPKRIAKASHLLLCAACR